MANANMWRLGSGSRGTPQGYKHLTDCIYLQDSSVKVGVFGLFKSRCLLNFLLVFRNV
ncbi:unnamed protein product [Meloidogyne enterolobii]|uniref:Uncharacterized protein n=1 Tax=Meloidogyne enterolobii TaxID=390850 RepID=A0ACB0YQU3_MELEN